MDSQEILVLGYGGNDDSIMKLLEAVPNESGLYWCTHTSEAPGGRVADLIGRPNVFRIQVDGFDPFLGELLSRVGFALPSVDEHVREQRNAIIKIFEDSHSPHADTFLEQTAKAITAEQAQDLEHTEPDLNGLRAQGMAHDRRLEFSKAAEQFRLVLERTKGSVSAADLFRLGQVLLDLGQATEAIRVLRQAEDKAPDNLLHHVLNALGLALLDDGRVEDSWESLRKARNLAPDDIGVLSSFALVAYQVGRKEESRDAFEEVIDLTARVEANTSYASMVRAVSLTATDRVGEGLSILQEMASRRPRPEYDLQIGRRELLRYSKAGISDAEEPLALIPWPKPDI